jgi:hypothetical protein
MELTLWDEVRQVGEMRRDAVKEHSPFVPSRRGKRQIYSSRTTFTEKTKILACCKKKVRA